MKKIIKTTLLLSSVIFFSACSTTSKINPSKPEMSVPDNYTGPTFNHLFKNWNY